MIEHYETNEFQLFHLLDDIGEANDLAERHPQTVDKLRRRLEAWRREVGADPMRPNPQFRQSPR